MKKSRKNIPDVNDHPDFPAQSRESRLMGAGEGATFIM
jgi:hypothetical protein